MIAPSGIIKASFLSEIKYPAKRAVAAIGEKFGISAKNILRNAKQKTILESTINLILLDYFINFLQKQNKLSIEIGCFLNILLKNVQFSLNIQ